MPHFSNSAAYLDNVTMKIVISSSLTHEPAALEWHFLTSETGSPAIQAPILGQFIADHWT